MNNLLFIVLFLLSQSAHAFRLSPMVLELDPQGDGASGAFLLENPGTETLAIQLSMHERVVDETGKETRPPANDFALYPAQVTLKAGEKKSVRLTWTGSAKPTRELPFRLVASQLPVDFQKKSAKKSGAAIKFLLEYVASVYVVPENAQAKVVLEKVEAGKNDNLRFTLKNTGTAHQLLTDLRVQFLSAGKKFSPEAAQLKDIRSENLLPGGTRVFELPRPKDFPKDNIRGEIQL